MLLFRNEEHVERWCRQWKVPVGAIMSPAQAWQLAKAWFSADRGAPDWKRPGVDEVEALFERLALTAPFWRLR